MLEPSQELARKYIAEFDAEEVSDKAIIQLINTFPKNERIEDILLKVTVINSLYGTNIYDLKKMAEHIKTRSFDERLAKNDLGLIEDIALGHDIVLTNRTKESYLFSFATKYCNWHSHSGYPIYDKYAARVLIAFRDKELFPSLSEEHLKNSDILVKVILDFKKRYGLTDFNFKEIDKFLWKYGKKFFNKKI